MEEKSKFDESGRVDRQLLVKLCRLGVVLGQEELVHPIMQRVENASKWIQDWHTSGEHENTPEVSVVLSVHIVT